MHAPQLAPPSRQEILDLLRTRFSHRRFRPGQEEVLQALLTGQNVLAVLPTGAGKSLVFQIASQVLPGLTIVISPLLALTHDQEESLEERGVEVAVINSTLSPVQADAEVARLTSGEARLLYVTPERLLNEAFVPEIAALPVSLLVVDEAPPTSTTANVPSEIASGSRTRSWRARSASWRPPAPSGSGSTSLTSASSSTATSRPASRRTTRRPAGPGATASLPTRCWCTVRMIWGAPRSSPGAVACTGPTWRPCVPPSQRTTSWRHGSSSP